MKINTLLKITVIAILLTSGANFFILYAHNKSLKGTIERLVHEDQRLALGFSDIYAQGLQSGQATRNVILNPQDEQAKRNYGVAQKTLFKAVDEATLLTEGAKREALTQIRALFVQLGEVRDAAQKKAVSGHQQEAIALMNASETPLWRKIKKTVLDLLSGQREAAEGSLAETSRAIRLSQILNVLTLVLMAAVLMVLWVLFHRKVITPITRVSAGLWESSDQVASASSQVSAASQSLAEGSSEQASSLEETSASIEEMASMTSQNAENSHQANTLMGETGQVVNEANQSMQELTGAMAEITSGSENMAKIIKTIDEIAFQTNLLALNAAVEAARAGEAGAGFAVVADEVRNLALRSAESAKNTANLIDESIKRIKNGSEIVERTNDAFERVLTGARKVGELVGEIAAASGEQAQGISQISKAIAEMDRVVQQNAANAEESASASEELNAQAMQMKDLVGELALLVRRTEGGKGAAKAPSGRKESGMKHLAQSPFGRRRLHGSEKVDPEQVIPMKDDDGFRDF